MTVEIHWDSLHSKVLHFNSKLEQVNLSSFLWPQQVKSARRPHAAHGLDSNDIQQWIRQLSMVITDLQMHTILRL